MMNQEFENVNDDRVKLLEKLDELKRQVQKLKQEKDVIARNFQREVHYFLFHMLKNMLQLLFNCTCIRSLPLTSTIIKTLFMIFIELKLIYGAMLI